MNLIKKVKCYNGYDGEWWMVDGGMVDGGWWIVGWWMVDGGWWIVGWWMKENRPLSSVPEIWSQNGNIVLSTPSALIRA